MAESPTPSASPESQQSPEEQRLGAAFLTGFSDRCEQHGVQDVETKQQLVDTHFAAQQPKQ